MLAQARDFVAMEAPQEAVARIRIVVRECERALVGETDSHARHALAQMLHRAAEALAEAQEAELRWRAHVRASEEHFVEREQEELTEPLAEPEPEAARVAHEAREAEVLATLRPHIAPRRTR